MTGSPHFDVIEALDPGPVVVEIPHAGLAIDPNSARYTKIPAAPLEGGALVADSDIAADLLWLGAELVGITRVVARTSRHVIDLNTEPRLPTAAEEKLPDAMREVRHRSHSGHTWWVPPLSRKEIERRVVEIAEPYHASVARALDAARARHGAAILVSSHTFPETRETPCDVVIGTRRGAAASEALRDVVADVITRSGFTVALEHPFPGAWSLARHGRPAEGVSAVQIELAQRAFLRPTEASRFGHDPELLERASRTLREVARALRDTIPAPSCLHGRRAGASD